MERLYQIMSTTAKQCCEVTSEFAKKRGKKVAVMGAATLLASGVVSAQIQTGPDPRGPRPNIEGRLSNLENIVGMDGTTNPPAYTLTDKVKELTGKVKSLEDDKTEAGTKEQLQDQKIGANEDRSRENKEAIEQLKPQVASNTESLSKVDGKIDKAKQEAITEAGTKAEQKIEEAKNELTGQIETAKTEAKQAAANAKTEAITEAGKQADAKITNAKADITNDIAKAKDEAIGAASKETDAKITATKTEFDGKLKDLSDKTVKIEQHNKDIAQLKAVEQVHEVRIANVEKEVKVVGANAAALAALKPLPYNPGQTTQIMAGVGTYRGESAVALGAAHYASQNLMYHAGVSFGSGSGTMANAGVTIGVGSGETAKAESPKVTQLQNAVDRLTEENERVKAALYDIYAKLQAK